MMRLMIVAIALSGCSLVPGTDAHDIKLAHQAVSDQLRDPDTARFRNDRRRGEYICGELNARNAMGGYIGYWPYRYSTVTHKAEVMPYPFGQPTNEEAMLSIKIDEACELSRRA